MKLKFKTIAAAVTSQSRFEGCGDFWRHGINRGMKLYDALLRNSMTSDTSDQREARNASMELRLHGSFREAVRRQVEREQFSA